MTPITRSNINQLLDSGQIRAQMAVGHWLVVRRNGKTQLWKKSSQRFRIPFKIGLRMHGAFTEQDLTDEGCLDSNHFRVEADVIGAVQRP